MDAKCLCTNCSQPISFPEEMAGQSIECPDCKMETLLFIAPPPKPEATPATPAPAIPQKFTLPEIEDSAVAMCLTIVAALGLIGSPFAGLVIGSGYNGNEEIGWFVFAGGVINGLILLGFARVIQNTFESSQRLRRIEMLMERDYNEKLTPKP